ncbi:MAG: hypothetical protein ACOYVJ_02500 [Nitrospirota bacterium]
MPAWWIPYAITTGAGLLKSIFGGNKSTELSPFEKQMQAQIQNYIARGGIGLTNEQLAEEYQAYKEPLMRDIEGLRATGRESLAGRGLLRSGAANRMESRLAQTAFQELSNKWRLLQAENRRRKQESLMQLLGLGTGLAAQYGQARREAAMGEQDIWNRLMGTGILGLLRGKRGNDFEYGMEPVDEYMGLA